MSHSQTPARNRAARSLHGDRVFPALLVVLGSIWFFAAPSDQADLTDAVFGLTVALSGLLWLVLTTVRRAGSSSRRAAARDAGR